MILADLCSPLLRTNICFFRCHNFTHYSFSTGIQILLLQNRQWWTDSGIHYPSLNTFQPRLCLSLPNVCLDVVRIPSNHSCIKYSSQDKTCHQLGILYSHLDPRYSRYLATMCISYNVCNFPVSLVLSTGKKIVFSSWSCLQIFVNFLITPRQMSALI